MIHTPVLLQETVEALHIISNKRYIDATFGEGGHSYEIARQGGNVLALDYDETTVSRNQQNAATHQVQLVHGNYADIKTIAKENQFVPCAGILFDLGLSMEQLIQDTRGFSYKKESAFLDMRLSRDIEVTAEDIVTNFNETDLYETFVMGAEELNSRAIVQSIVRTRRLKPIKTVGDLNKVIAQSVSDKGMQLEKIFRRIYQALFIAVNNEFENIKRGLQGAYECLEEKGRIVVITFHPGHERIVKRFAKQNEIAMKTIRAKGKTARFERSATIRILLKS